MSSENFAYWNDTSIAHMFIRLITKTNHPYNNVSLTLEEYQNDYNTLKCYMEWHELNYAKSFSLYNFTQTNMLEIFNQMDYNIDNKDYLLELWKTKMLCVFKKKD